MNTPKTRSELWTNITSSLFSKIDDVFIGTFRAPGGANSRLAAWDPFDKSMRYYKFLLFNIARNKSELFFEAYSKLQNTLIGNPVSVKVNGCEIDIDYLFSVEEFLFLNNSLNTGNIKKVVEIGAGFGRTCHGLLTLSNIIEEYSIIDLPEVLELSSAYLKKAIPEHFDKIKFIKNIDDSSINNLQPDLVINIDSFQEMPPEVIDNYMLKVISKSKMFYCKNPIGKYEPENVGLPKLKPDQLLDVYSLGYCQNIYDLFNENILIEARKKYCISYLPTGDWKLIADEPVEIFPYLQNALYYKD
jgi:putative sugar O-methyltransferase